MEEPWARSDVRLVREEPLLFPALTDAVRWAGAWLVARKVPTADVVALYTPNTIEFVATRHLAAWTGVVTVTISPLLPSQGIFGPPGRPGACCLVTVSQVFVRKPAAQAGPSPVIESGLIDRRTTPGAWGIRPGRDDAR
jgi:acyl-coenzyme A synthetase/AMP-(fatty) acid ligase